MLTRKVGPLPVWVWAVIGLALAIIYKTIMANRAASAAAAAQTDPGTGVQLIGGDQTPPVVFQNFTNVTTPITVPPGGGRMFPPVMPPVGTTPPVNMIPPIIPRIIAPGVAPPPPPSAPAGQWVTIAKWTKVNAPWNSTLFGIAKQLKGNGNAWGAIWNDPANAAERTRRKEPKLIQPGDRIFVPA